MNPNGIKTKTSQGLSHRSDYHHQSLLESHSWTAQQNRYRHKMRSMIKKAFNKKYHVH
jgi:hypothetical protein